MQGFPFFERLPDSHLSDFGGDNSAPLGPRLLSYSKGIEQLDTHLAMFRRRLPSRHHMSSTFRVIKAVIFSLFICHTNQRMTVGRWTDNSPDKHTFQGRLLPTAQRCNQSTLNHWAVGRNIRPHLRLAIRLTVETDNFMYGVIW